MSLFRAHRDAPVFGHRLSLSNSDPAPTSDVTAATNIYVVPYLHDRISLPVQGTTRWKTFDTGGTYLTQSLSGLTADKNCDLFAYASGGSIALEVIYWTNDTTRGVALVRNMGALVKNIDTHKLWLGTFKITGSTGQCEDSLTKRFVCNAMNRIRKRVSQYDSTGSWNYPTSTWRSRNGSSTNRIHLVQGHESLGGIVDLEATALMFSDAVVSANIGIGYDSTSTPDAAHMRGGQLYVAEAGQIPNTFVRYVRQIATGYHYLQQLEYGGGSGTNTWYGGSNFGMIGWWEC